MAPVKMCSHQWADGVRCLDGDAAHACVNPGRHVGQHLCQCGANKGASQRQPRPDHPSPRTFVASRGWLWEGQVWAACECGWLGQMHDDLMAGISLAMAAVQTHARETGHDCLNTPDDLHLRCGVRHQLNHDCPYPPDSPAGLLYRATTQPTLGSRGDLDRLAAIPRLRARLDEEEKDAVIGARLSRRTWTEMGEAVGISRQGAWNRWGPMVQRYEQAGLMGSDSKPEANQAE